MASQYEVYLEKRDNRLRAERWLKLLDARDSQSGHPFSMSPAHSSLKLTICGQHSCGGQNYHESDKELNRAMLLVVKKRLRELGEEAVDVLKREEASALLNCREFVASMNKEMDKAEAILSTEVETAGCAAK